MEEQIVFTTDEGESILFYVLEETRISGMNYLLVTDSEEDEADCYILKDVSKQEEPEAVYEMVTDDETIDAVLPVFRSLLENTDIR